MSEERFRWIPIKERVPSHDNQVLGCLSDGFVAFCRHHNDKWEIFYYKKIKSKLIGWIELDDYDGWLKDIEEKANA